MICGATKSAEPETNHFASVILTGRMLFVVYVRTPVNIMRH